MAQMLLQTIEQIGKEKNIEPEIIVAAIEEAMTVASKKFYATEETLEARLNRESGEVELHAVKQVVDEVEDPDSEISLEHARRAKPDVEVGEVLRTALATDQLGRIAAQAAKQVIYQKVRDAERENIYLEFAEREGELITGIVKRFERGDMMVDLGRTESILPRREQSRAEHYNIGARIRVVIVEILRASRGPQIVVSRTSPELLRRLFEMEVPEIYDGTVVIKRAVREGGDRAKVAVHSVESDVDAVGACVGMRGSRVQAIIRELRGEKIDIVEWSPDPTQFSINALKPARVNRVSTVTVPFDDDPEAEPLIHYEVIVDDDQLSLAIGKKGQNVRLAGKLLRAKIDVKSEEQKREEVETELLRLSMPPKPVNEVPGVGPKVAKALSVAGFDTAMSLADSTVDDLLTVPGIGAKTAGKLIAAAADLVAAALVDSKPSAVETEKDSVVCEVLEVDEDMESDGSKAGEGVVLEVAPEQANDDDDIEVDGAEGVAKESDAENEPEMLEPERDLV